MDKPKPPTPIKNLRSPLKTQKRVAFAQRSHSSDECQKPAQLSSPEAEISIAGRKSSSPSSNLDLRESLLAFGNFMNQKAGSGGVPYGLVDKFLELAKPVKKYLYRLSDVQIEDTLKQEPSPTKRVKKAD